MFRRRRLAVLGLLALLLIVFYIASNVEKERNKTELNSSGLSTEEKELKMFEASLVDDGGFFDEVSGEILANGYKHILHGMIYSKEEVHIEFVLTNREAKEEVRNEILEIFNAIAIENKLEPSIFKVKIHSE